MLSAYVHHNDNHCCTCESAVGAVVSAGQSLQPVWWMRVDIDSQLSSILAFSTYLKRIQTPHRLFWDFGADKTSTTRGS